MFLSTFEDPSGEFDLQFSLRSQVVLNKHEAASESVIFRPNERSNRQFYLILENIWTPIKLQQMAGIEF